MTSFLHLINVSNIKFGDRLIDRQRDKRTIKEMDAGQRDEQTDRKTQTDREAERQMDN